MKEAKTTFKFRVLFFLCFFMLGCFWLFQLLTDYSADAAVVGTAATALYLDSTQPIEVRVASILAQMTRVEKIGQMALVEKNSVVENSDIAKYNLGGLLSGSGAKPVENTFSGWKEMIDLYQAEASNTRLGIPLLYGSDAIHGHAHVQGATIFPHALGLGAANNPELVRKVAGATSVELVATGVNWNFGPNLDQPQDIRWGRTYEAFSDDPALVAKLGAAYLEGLQEQNRKGVLPVLATAKHFLGLGAMEWNSSSNQNFKIDQGVTKADEVLLRSRYLPPFAAAIDAGALSIMVGLNDWGEEKVIQQKYLLTDILKTELQFKGFIVSDWYGVYEGRTNTFWATIQAVNAGVDMVMLPFDYKTFTRQMAWANRLGLISDQRLDEAVGRILYAKFSLGLFDQDAKKDLLEIQDGSHQALARDAVAQSVVLLKNEDGLLPLKKNIQSIRVAGSAADNVGQQLGAWSIEWQGIDGNWLQGATSILAGIKAEVSDITTVEYRKMGDFAPGGKKAAIGIAVVGEKPYAEGWGDREYPILTNDDLLAIQNLQASCEQVVVVIVAGRPLLIKNEIDSFAALVMAWLPGSEGAGVADVLFGRKPFVGKLPLPWPDHAEQLPIALDEATADATPVLFGRYFGLTK